MTRQKPASPVEGPLKEPIEARTLPHNLEAERSILGAVLLHDEVLEELDALSQADFYRQGHRLLFAAMHRLKDAGRRVELVTLKDELSRLGELDEVGGPAYISALVDGVPRSTNVRHYAAIVIEKSRLRAAIFAANRLLVKAYDGEDRAAEVASEAAEELYDLGGSAMGAEPVPIRALITPGIEMLEQRSSATEGTVSGVATGFERLDDMTAGLQPSDLVLIAARTSQGKTALMMNMVKYIAVTLPVLAFSLEMSKEQLFLRMLSAEARVDSHHLRIPSTLTPDEWGRIASSLDVIGNLNLFIHDEPGIGVREVRARARQVRAKHGLAAVFVDYIGLMKGRGKFDNRTQEIATISRGLKGVAKELKVPLVALAQLSRAPDSGMYGKKPRRPQLTDLAESSSLENDADVVLFIYRPEPKADDAADPPAEIIIAKQRNGPTGTVKLAWNREYVRFENLGMV